MKAPGIELALARRTFGFGRSRCGTGLILGLRRRSLGDVRRTTTQRFGARLRRLAKRFRSLGGSRFNRVLNCGRGFRREP